MTCSLGNEGGQGCTRAGDDATILHRDLGENRFGQAEDDTTDPFITHQNIAAGSKYAKRNAFVRANPEHGRKFCMRAWLDQPLCRPAQLEIRVGSQHLIGFDNLAKFFQTSHLLSL